MQERAESKTRGFTLTELLVVISVGAMLVGAMLPTLNTAQDTMKAAVCLSNMHQWGLGFSLYAADQNDYWPYEGDGSEPLDAALNPHAWYNVVPPYLGQPTLVQLYNAGKPPTPLTNSIWSCPSATNIMMFSSSASPLFMYAFNGRMDPNGAAQFKRGQCVSPANTILFAEEPEDNFPGTSGTFAAARHFGGGNFVLCDSHAEWITYDNFCRSCPANPSSDSNSSPINGDWKMGIAYHWFPYRGAPT